MTTHRNNPPTAADEQFLRRLRTRERIMQLTDADVQQLRADADRGDAHAQYALGRWLYFRNPHDGAMQEAEQLLLAASNDVPDALAAYAQMVRYGDAEATHPEGMNIDEADRLLLQASRQGSELADLQRARYRIYGVFCDAEPAAVAAEITQRLADGGDQVDPFWHCLLAYALEQLGRADAAADHYEQAIRQGEVSPYGYLAFYYQQRGNMALYEELMEEGMTRGCATCYLYQADTSDDDFQLLSADEQQQLHAAVDARLRQGLLMGEGLCAYYLYANYYYSSLGYQRDDVRAFAYLEQGVRLGCSTCMLEQALEAQSAGLPGRSLTAADKAELWLRAARYAPDDDDALYYLQRAGDPAFLLRHKEELERYWQPRFKQPQASPVDAGSPAAPAGGPKTAIEPSVIVIWPGGHLDVVEADVSAMASYREMAQALIGGDNLDAVHYSPLLYTIGEAAELSQPLVMYVDRDAQQKHLPDNAIGTMLYGGEAEVRGPVIICLQDQRHDCHSFTTKEDIVATYTEIDSHSGGLLIIKDEDDGRYDAYV